MRHTTRWAGIPLLLALAMIVSGLDVRSASPAHADEPVVLLESPPLGPSGSPVLTVTSNDLNVSAPVVVTNPGGTAPTPQQCTFVSPPVGTFCLGSSDQLVTSNSIPLAPMEIEEAESAPYRLPGDSMDWIVDEAVAAVAAVRGLAADDLVRAYARPEIRAYVYSRIQLIMNKKLYGEPLDDREQAVVEAIEGIYRQRLVDASSRALAEYDRWSNDPCSYRPPTPPAGLPAVPNPLAESSACTRAGARFSLWTVTRGTPSASSFDTWASYRHPSPSMKHATDPTYLGMTAATAAGLVNLIGFAFATTVGVGVALALAGISAATAESLATAIGVGLGVFTKASAGTVAGATAAVVGSVAALVAIIIVAIIILAVSIWQMVEDAKPLQQLKDRAAAAAAATDPLGIEARMADYEGLDMLDAEEPAGKEPALIHQPRFLTELLTLVNEWQMFTPSGRLIPDPLGGYNPTGETTPDDIHFAENGVSRDSIAVLAPSGTLNRHGQEISGYRVTFSRGFPMVSEHVLLGADLPYEPRTALTYLDADGTLASMSILQIGQEDGPPIRRFQLMTPGPDDKPTYEITDSWTFQSTGGQLRTVTLLEGQPLTPAVNVIPSVQGDLVADHLVELRANPSTPAFAKSGGSFLWTVDRLDDSGAVDGTFTSDTLGFQHRFAEPGNYRAKVTYTWTGPEAGSASGRVEFAIERPAAEIMTAAIEDTRVEDGSLSLNLRLAQNTRSDTFDVAVEWADDGLGNKVVENYTVECIDTGFDTCETGPIPAAPAVPTNPQWSRAPVYKAPDGQSYLPHVTVTITNSYGETITRVFPITGEHRPRYADSTPYAEMPVGTFSVVDVVRVIPADHPSLPAPTTPGISQLEVLPFVAGMLPQLPAGVTPDIELVDGEWWLQLRGVPTADDIGAHTFYFPVQQNVDNGLPRRPVPVLATVEIVSSTQPGYRGILRGVPQDLADRSYRTAYPDWTVQAAQRLTDEQEFADFADFSGTVRCTLAAGGTLVFDKPCRANEPFPWPHELISDTLEASVHLESESQPISTDGAYGVALITRFLDPTVTVDPVTAQSSGVDVRLRLKDGRELPAHVAPPYAVRGFTITCSLDGTSPQPCLDSGAQTFAKTPGAHTLDVTVEAPDGETVGRRVSWDGGLALVPSSTGLRATLRSLPSGTADLRKRFELSLERGGPVPVPFSAQGYAVACSIDGRPFSPCLDGGALSLPRVPGRHTLAVRVTASDGEAVLETLTWRVATPAHAFRVAAPAGSPRAGDRLQVTARGLLPREPVVFKIAGRRVGEGIATLAGKVGTTVRIPSSTRPGVVKVVVRGATPQRRGQDSLTVRAGGSTGPRLLDAGP